MYIHMYIQCKGSVGEPDLLPPRARKHIYIYMYIYIYIYVYILLYVYMWQ